MPKKGKNNNSQNNNQNSNLNNNQNNNLTNNQKTAEEMRILEEIKQIDNNEWVIFNEDTEPQKNADKVKKNDPSAVTGAKSNTRQSANSKKNNANNQETKNNTKKETENKPDKSAANKEANSKPAKETANAQTEKATENKPVAKPVEKMPEFIGYHNNNLPRWIMTTGNASIIDKFAKFHEKELSPAEKSFLNKKLENARKLDAIETANSYDSMVTKLHDEPEYKPQQELYKKGNVVRLKNIHQDHHQTSGNGCWSHPYSMMLQSKGVNVSPEEIRDFRPELTAEEAKNTSFETFKHHNFDTGKKPIDNADLLMKVCPNTAMVELSYNSPTLPAMKVVGGSGYDIRTAKLSPEETKEYLKNYKKAVCDDLKAKITEAIEVDRCPVGITYGGHYRTVVGINKKSGKLIMKDSKSIPKDDISFSMTEPDDNIEVSINDIVSQTLFSQEALKENSEGATGVGITWLKDLPTKDNKLGQNISYDEKGNLKYTETENNSSMRNSEDYLLKSGFKRSAGVTSNSHWDQSKNKFKVFGYGLDGNLVMAYENFHVPKKIYAKGEKIEKLQQVDDYEPHSYDLLEGSLEKYQTYVADKLGNNLVKIPKMDEQMQILALGDTKLAALNKYLENAEKEIQKAKNPEAAEKIRKEIKHVEDKRDEFIGIKANIEENLPYARLEIKIKAEKERRTENKVKNLEEYKESAYRSIALDQLKKQFVVFQNDTFEQRKQKKDQLREMLKEENLQKEVDKVKASLSGINTENTALNSKLREMFEQKLTIAYQSGDLKLAEEKVIWKPADNRTLAKDIEDMKAQEAQKKLLEEQKLIEEQKMIEEQIKKENELKKGAKKVKQPVLKENVKAKDKKIAKEQAQAGKELDKEIKNAPKRISNREDVYELEMMLAKSASLLVYEMMNAKKDNRVSITKPGEKLIDGTENVRDDFALKLRNDGKVQEAYDRYANLLELANTMGYKKSINPDIKNADQVLNEFAAAELPNDKVKEWNKQNAQALKQKKQQVIKK